MDTVFVANINQFLYLNAVIVLDMLQNNASIRNIVDSKFCNIGARKTKLFSEHIVQSSKEFIAILKVIAIHEFWELFSNSIINRSDINRNFFTRLA